MDELRSSPPGVVEQVEFRDGFYDVPQYLLGMILAAGIDTLSVTYEEARRLASNAGLRNLLNSKVNAVIRDHQKEYG